MNEALPDPNTCEMDIYPVAYARQRGLLAFLPNAPDRFPNEPIYYRVYDYYAKLINKKGEKFWSYIRGYTIGCPKGCQGWLFHTASVKGFEDVVTNEDWLACQYCRRSFKPAGNLQELIKFINENNH